MLVLTLSHREVVKFVMPNDIRPGEEIIIRLVDNHRGGTAQSVGIECRKDIHITRHPVGEYPPGVPNSER